MRRREGGRGRGTQREGEGGGREGGRELYTRVTARSHSIPDVLTSDKARQCSHSIPSSSGPCRWWT